MINDFRNPGEQNGMFKALMRSGQEGGLTNSNLFGEEPRRDLTSVHRGGMLGGRMGGLIDSMQGGAPDSPSGDQMASKYGKNLLKGAMERFTPENAPNKMTPMPQRQMQKPPMRPPMRGILG